MKSQGGVQILRRCAWASQLSGFAAIDVHCKGKAPCLTPEDSWVRDAWQLAQPGSYK